MTAQKSLKFWILFVLGAGVFLCAWFLFWEIRHRDLSTLGDLSSILPMTDQNKRSFETVAQLGSQLMNTNGEEKTFLILFQNNMELRPGGGFIGSFGILKIRDGRVTKFDVHDTGNFDGRIPDTVTPPYPMEQTLKIHSWKLRDSNWSPDWKENALQAIDFYRLGGREDLISEESHHRFPIAYRNTLVDISFFHLILEIENRVIRSVCTRIPFDFHRTGNIEK
jgi:hypothetical protein